MALEGRGFGGDDGLLWVDRKTGVRHVEGKGTESCQGVILTQLLLFCMTWRFLLNRDDYNGR